MKRTLFLIPMAIAQLSMAELITADATNDSINERLSALEKSVSNINEIAIMSKLEAMQNQIITLNRQIDFLQAGQNTLPTNESTPSATSTAPAPLTLSSVYKAIAAQKWDEALTMISKLDNNPGSEDLAEIRYWRGEILLEKGSIEQAKAAFSELVNSYPNHNRAPDSLLKLSSIARKEGNQLMASRYIETLKVQYPNSTALQYLNTTSQN